MGRKFTLADGQVAATATAIFAASALPYPNLGGRVSVSFTNVGGSSETLVVTFTRDGGTARRVARATLSANEQLVIVGLGMEGADTLLAATSNATSVDYLVSDAGDTPFEVYALDANGTRKTGGSFAPSSLTVSEDLNLKGSSGVTFEAWDASDVSVLWSNAPSRLEPDFHQRCFEFFDDFLNPASATISDYHAYTKTTGAGGTAAFQDAAGGIFNVVTAAVDNDHVAYSTVAENWLFAAGKKLWFEARFKLAEATTNESAWWFGLTDTLTTGGFQANTAGPLASYDGALIWKDEATMAIDFETSNAGTQATTTAMATFVTDTWTRVGFYFDGAATTSVITPYYDIGAGWVAGTPQNITLAGLEEMHLVFGVKAGPTAAAETLQVDYVRCVQVR